MDEKSFSRSRYSHRDYNSLKNDFLSIVPSLTEEWTDFSESSPGVVYIKLAAMLGDNLSYNFDKNVLELFRESVTQRKNCRKLMSLIGYHMSWYKSAKVTVTVVPTSTLQIRSFYTTFSSGGEVYTLIKSHDQASLDMGVPVTYTVPALHSRKFDLVEGTVQSLFINKSSVYNNMIPISSTQIDDSHIWIQDSTGTVLGTLVDDLRRVTDQYNLYYELYIDDFDTPYLKLSDSWSDLITTDSFTVNYIQSSGADGNISTNVFTTVENIILGDSSTTSIANPSNSAPSIYGEPGRNPETVDEAVKASANYSFTHDTLVTEDDFERACRRIPGVLEAKLLDNYIITKDGLDIEDIVSRGLDDFTGYLTEEETSLLVGVVLLYLYYNDGASNQYTSTVGDLHFDGGSSGLGKIDFFSSGNAVKAETLGYFPYKADQDVLAEVSDYLQGRKLMTVSEDYGTLKMFPYTLNGTVYLSEPVSPFEVQSIANKIDTNVREAVSSLSLGDLPNILNVIDTIQKSDSRIRYFGAGETSPLEFLIKGATATTEPTSKSVYSGLAYKQFTPDGAPNVNVSHILTFNPETLKFKIFYNPITEFESEEPQPVTIIPAPEDSYLYETIVLPIPVEPAGSPIVIQCENLAQVNTLVYHLTYGMWEYIPA